MMKARVGLFILLLALSVRFAQAQDATPAALWPPDPKQIFAEGVQVVKTEIVTPPEETYPKADNARRVIRLYDEATKQWHEYPYPAEMEQASSIQKRTDGTYLIDTDNLDKAWILDPATGQFSHPEMVCGDQIKAMPNEGKWVIVRNENRGYLCFTETNELSKIPLPEGIVWGEYVDDLPRFFPPISPDGKWLALMGIIEKNNGTLPTIVIYSYEISTGKLIYLGEIVQPYDSTTLGEWRDNTHFTVHNDRMPQMMLTKEVYVADATQPNSLHYAMSAYDEPVETTAFLQDLTGSQINPHVPCTWTRYAPDLSKTTYNLGYDCSDARLLPFKDGYVYVRIDEEENLSVLTYFDATTGKLTELAGGEIEYVDSVSPDQRYIVLVIDSNGRIDLRDYYSDWINWQDFPNAYLAIFDTLTGNFVYTSKTISTTSPTYVISNWVAEWVDATNILLSVDSKSVSLITLDSSGVTEVNINDAQYDELHALWSPDHRHLITTINRHQMGVADFSQRKAIPILRPGADTQYFIVMDWVDNRSLRVSVHQQPEPLNASYIRYTLRLP